MHHKFLKQAIHLAKENAASGKGGPYGAVIVKHNQVVAASSNKVANSLDPTAHAEILAIRAACQQLKNFQLTGCILYTSCEPCPMCLGAIYWARLDTVYYACNRHDAAAANFDDSFIYDEINLLPEHRLIPMLHINLPNAREPFDTWNNNLEKIPY